MLISIPSLLLPFLSRLLPSLSLPSSENSDIAAAYKKLSDFRNTPNSDGTPKTEGQVVGFFNKRASPAEQMDMAQVLSASLTCRRVMAQRKAVEIDFRTYN